MKRLLLIVVPVCRYPKRRGLSFSSLIEEFSSKGLDRTWPMTYSSVTRLRTNQLQMSPALRWKREVSDAGSLQEIFCPAWIGETRLSVLLRKVV